MLTILWQQLPGYPVWAASHFHQWSGLKAGSDDLRGTMPGEKPNLKREAEELLDLGFSHQQAFDQLALQHPEAKPKKIAGLLRHRPSKAAKERYRSLHLVLLALVALSAALRIWTAFGHRQVDMEHAWRLFGLVPFATLFMAWALYHWDGQHFEWVGWMNILGAAGVFRSLSRLAEGSVLSMGEVGGILSVAIGALALYLHSKAFPKYAFHKDPMGGPGRHEFQERT